MARSGSRYDSLVFLGLIALVALGCAGEGTISGDGPPPNGPAGSFAQVQQEIFDRSCTAAACHNSSFRAGNLSLTTGESYDNLVGVEPDNATARSDGLLRVAPSEPDRSFILRKLTGDLGATEGSAMPLGAAQLDEASIELIASWITAGALRDPEAGASDEPSLAEVQEDVFDRRCTSDACHSAANRAGGLSLSPGDSYAALVGAAPENPSARGAGFVRVKAGSADESFLVAKLTGDLAAGEGAMMPLGAPMLSDDELDLIRRWIQAGARPG
jgi:mono/diheme cytochrome c family protein